MGTVNLTFMCNRKNVNLTVPFSVKLTVPRGADTARRL